MAKMRDLLRSKPKVDEEELALSQARIAARLAGLRTIGAVLQVEEPSAAGTSPEQAADANPPEDDAVPSGQPVMPPFWPGGPRPPIVVDGEDRDTGIESETGAADPIGVMARPGEDVGDDDWELPALLAADAEPMATPPPSSAPGTASPDAPKRRARAARPAVATRRRPAGRSTKSKARTKPVPPAACPYCAVLLLPPPATSRRCEQCRQRIIVRRVEGRAVYLTQAALLVFDAERRRIASSGRLARERERWLRLAELAGESGPRATRLARAALSEEVVSAARALYVSVVDRAFRAARRDQDWESASRIRRDQATALYRIARAPLPPPAEIVALYREGVVAELRGIAKVSRDAELVSGACCDGCRADDRRVFRIAHEVREPRLPHAGCPRGLCRCRWDLAARDRIAMRRLLQRRPRTESRAARSDPATTA